MDKYEWRRYENGWYLHRGIGGWFIFGDSGLNLNQVTRFTRNYRHLPRPRYTNTTMRYW